MAPKKKAGAKPETPEQLAARRAAAMAMFATTSAPKPGAAGASKAPVAAAAAAQAAVDISDDAVDISDASPYGTAGTAGKEKIDDVFSDGGTDVRVQALAYAASTFGMGGEALVTALPTDGSWVQMLFMDPMAAMVKKAKKEGETQALQNECKLLTLKGVAYLFAKEGTHAATWRTKLEGLELGTGDQPSVRLVADKIKLIHGKDGAMLKAIQAHSNATVTLLPTGHVAVLGRDGQVATAVKLINNLVDGDGEETRNLLAEHLVVAEPWCGELLFPCAEDFVGGVIGKGGMGLKAIASESGALIDYIEPPEEATPVEGGESKEEGTEEEKAMGHFRIRGKFENQCRLAVKRIEERLTVVQKLDTHGYVMIPRGAIGRMIGKGGTNIKVIQRASGASRISFEKEGGGRTTTQACYLIASDIESALGAAKVVLEAVQSDSKEAREELKARLTDYPHQLLALQGGKGEPPVDATREKCVTQHRTKYGEKCLGGDQQTKQNPAEFAAVDFEIWQWQWAVESKLVHGNAPKA